jgi:3-oxoacyl-[acyl-carrier protein] reductase
MPIDLDLSGRTAWVTGGASGIGAAIVDMLRRAGARVISFDRVYGATGDDSGAIVPVGLDVTDAAAVAQITGGLVQRGLAPDILVNNAGITRDGVVWKLADDDWDAVLDVNLTGAFRMTRAAVPPMRSRGAGSIVNVASINGIRGKFGQSNYAASKGGLIAFTKAVAREVGRSGVRVNAVAPGFVDTPLTAALPGNVKEHARAEALLGRFGTPDDIAAAVLFLASPLAAYVTGQVLIVDGGQIA